MSTGAHVFRYILANHGGGCANADIVFRSETIQDQVASVAADGRSAVTHRDPRVQFLRVRCACPGMFLLSF